MQISKNKKYQYSFFFILIIYTIFNGGNSNILIQINFILVSILFLFCLKDKNYIIHLTNFFKNNKKSIIIYLIFIFYLLFQIIPLPVEILKFFSPMKYNVINELVVDSSYHSISIAPGNSFFQIINYATLLILTFIINMIFYTERHKNRFYLFLSIIGFLSSIIAITFYLNNNPDIFIIKNSYYKNASTGFFINRTVFAVFLLFSLISSLELLKNLNVSAKKKDNFFLKIYIRLFVIFISIAIITSFSRIGNFLLLFTIFFYFINEILIKKNKNKSFKIILLIIIIFDILIMGIYFGSFQIMDRFYFLKEEFSEIYDSNLNLSRFDIARFGLNQIKNFLFFGYGSGAFEFLFQTNFINLKNSFANHAHSDLVEFVGEFGLLGITLLFFSLLRFFLNKRFFNFLNSIFFFYLLIILLFDFSLHIPIIQILFITFFILNFKKTN